MLTRCEYSSSEIMSVSGHKSVQSLAVYQKTKEKQKINLGKTLFQSMMRSEDEIDVRKNKEIAPPAKLQAIEAPPSVLVAQSESASTPIMAIENEETSASTLVPFDANFDEDGVSDMDLLSAICGVSENVTTTVSNTSTSNVLTSFPKAMFANCQIGSINVNFTKKNEKEASLRLLLQDKFYEK